MSTFLQVERVKCLCSCGKRQPVCWLYLCRHCLKLRCNGCVSHEVDCLYCPNCLENITAPEAKLKRNRCSNCFDCPSCGHTLSTRATSIAQPTADDPTKTTPKKMYYMACGFCRCTTRDANIKDQSVASGAWEDMKNPHSDEVRTLLDHYHQIARKEKARNEHKKFTKRRNNAYYSDKYGLTSVAAKRKSLSAFACLSMKDSDVVIPDLPPPETITEFEPLSEDLFTQPLQLTTVTTMEQRLASAEFQPSVSSDLYPIHKYLFMRHSLRCKECEHNLIRPDYTAMSIKFKIQLVALHHLPEIRIMNYPIFQTGKESLVILTMNNPATYTVNVKLMNNDADDDFANAKIMVPDNELVLASCDDSALLIDGSQNQADFKDDPTVIAFRKHNKIGFFVHVMPACEEGEVKVSFLLRHDYKNMAINLTTEEEPETIQLQHQLFLTLGRIVNQE